MAMTQALRDRINALSPSRTVPIATVSGVATTNISMIEWFDRETPVTIITTKSIQVHPNAGNREPIITEVEPGSFGNAVGLKNPGIDAFSDELASLRREHSFRAILNVSLAGSTVEEFVELAGKAGPLADVLELNVSCPHAKGGYGAVIGENERAVADITRAVVATASGIPVLVKLSPNVSNIGHLATIAVAAGAAGIVAINTAGPIVYSHKPTGKPILTNPPDHRGGQSGRWIRKTALGAVSAIRNAIGSEPIIIGMGGISTREEVREMAGAGADVIGVGSAPALVHQREWPAYLAGLSGIGRSFERVGSSGLGRTAVTTGWAGRSAGPNRTARSELTGQLIDTIPETEAPYTLRTNAAMDYVPFRVAQRRDLSEELFELELDGTIVSAPGQTVFLWLPDIGEKPFSPALNEPATFLIGRRGPLTMALGECTKGDTLYVRGPYGDSHTTPPHTKALLIGAGSGAAGLSVLAAAITSSGGNVNTAVAVRNPIGIGEIQRNLSRMGPVQYIPDKGQLGRLLQHLPQLIEVHDPSAIFLVGPEPFMAAAARVIRKITSVPLHLSLERPMHCGVGLCGACQNAGRLTCQHGTIVPYDHWEGRKKE